jgi:4-amino-4-deoxy-L-arabinose transferase-like glycosyltransferase
MDLERTSESIDVHDDPDGPPDPAGAQLPILSHNPETLPALKRTGKTPEWVVRLGIVALAAMLYLPNIGSFGLWDPWETHYGEVTRHMVETHDWVHPWWGYKGEKFGGEKGPGEHFYSKPILIFWMEATSVRAFGLSEFSIRFPIAMIAMLATFFVYLCFSQILDRGSGIRAAVVMATCPHFFFIARQAQTDMPFVGTLVIAMSFFALAVFGKRKETTDRGTWAVLGGTIVFLLMLVIPQLGIISADVNHAVPPGPGGVPRFWDQWRMTGYFQAITYVLVLIPLIVSMVMPAIQKWRNNDGQFTVGYRDTIRRKCFLWLFFMFCGLSTMGKGLLGFALPGLIIFLYILVTNEWTLLAQKSENRWRGRVELFRGILVFACVALPWYVALLSGPEGSGFYARFFVHDHFNRLGQGVHQIDSGTFEHFLKWLGYGMWPWVAFMPLALLGFARYRLRDGSPTNRLRLFLFLWFFVAYTLFTLSSTKFHHYIFPALPPLAILIGWELKLLLERKDMLARTAVVLAIGLFVLLGWDIFRNPQHFRNLFTYKYDREYPADHQRPIDHFQPIRFKKTSPAGWEPDQVWGQGDFYRHTPSLLHGILNIPLFRYERWIGLIGCLGFVGLVLMLFHNRGPPFDKGWRKIIGHPRTIGTGIVTTCGLLLATWSLNYYMPMLAPHWSQKYLFERYYDVCVRAPNHPDVDESFTPLIADNPSLESFFEPKLKRVCEEEVISWLLTWRGETFYSNNLIRPIQKEKKQMQPYLEKVSKGARFFVHIERTRARSFKGRVDSYLKNLSKNTHYKGIKEYEVTLEHNENYWFVLLRADPVCKPGFTKDTVGRCIATPPKAPTANIDVAPEGSSSTAPLSAG